VRIDYRPIEEIIRDTVLPIINSSSFHFPMKDSNVDNKYENIVTFDENISPSSLLTLLPIVNDVSSFSLKLTQEVCIDVDIYAHINTYFSE
jgi:hypothetical protein